MRAPSRKFIGGIALLALLAGGAVVAARSGPPQVAEDLEDVDEAGSAAQRQTERIIANLDAIAANLEAGAGMSTYSKRIHRLTNLQRGSLEELIGVLRTQLVTLDRTRSTLLDTSRAAEGVADAGRDQAAAVSRSVALLRELRALVSQTHATSAGLAQKARYAARLAEDSQRRFER